MPPLILHNVPDDELYVGEDGVRRPYAVVFPGSENYTGSLRSRKAMPESGSFGKSTRRSRSKTSGTPAKKEDPSLQAADAVFSKYFADQANVRTQATSQKSSSTSNNQSVGDSPADTTNSYIHKEPTEVILRGYSSVHQYAAIQHFEALAGRICEDYPREPPIEQRRYKSDLRDPAALRTRPLSAEEKSKALRFAGAEHWIKVTFESREAAESAIYASPQTIEGYLVYAEPYQGGPPTITDPMPAVLDPARSSARSRTSAANGARQPARTESRQTSDFPEMSQIGRNQASKQSQFSPSDSLTSTLDSGTLSNDTATASSDTVVSPNQSADAAIGASSSLDTQQPQSEFCSRIPTAKRAVLLPASEALLPQQSLSQRITANIPLVSWFSKDVIGIEVPRNDNGDFDWNGASLYWKVCWWLDMRLGWFGGDLTGDSKDE